MTGSHEPGLKKVLVIRIGGLCAKTPIEKKCSFNRCMDELKAEVVFENLQQLTNT